MRRDSDAYCAPFVATTALPYGYSLPTFRVDGVIFMRVETCSSFFYVDEQAAVYTFHMNQSHS